MKDRNQKDAAVPIQSVSFKAFANLMSTIVLLFRGCVAMLLSSPGLPEIPLARGGNKKHMSLQWRNPRWAWQMLSLVVAVVTAPTFLFISVLMMMNSQCDYASFWWSLPVIIIASNTVAILRANRWQHQRGFASPSDLANYRVRIAMETGGVLFALVGWFSGLLPDLIALFSGSQSLVLFFFGSIVLSGIFAILSFSHAGIIHLWLGFHDHY